MGQVGYIVTAIAISSQIGWVSAGWMTVNHLLFKGLLFLAVAGLIYRTGTRLMYQMGGLDKNMPMTFVSVLIGIIAISGVPPLTGFRQQVAVLQRAVGEGLVLAGRPGLLRQRGGLPLSVPADPYRISWASASGSTRICARRPCGCWCRRCC